MILKFFRATYQLPELPDPNWEQLRLALLRRSLLWLLPALCLYILFTALNGNPVLPSVAGLGFTLTVLLLLRERPTARRMLAWVLAGATIVLISLGLALTPGAPPSPVLVIAVILPSLGLLLDGPALAAAFGAAALGLVWSEFQRVPPGAPALATAVGQQAAAGLGVLVLVVGWYRAISRGQAALLTASRRLLAQRDERQVLALALFDELTRAQARLQAVLGVAGPVDWHGAFDAAQQMQARAVEIRGLRNRLEDPPLDAPAEADFGRGLLLALLWTGGSFAVAASLLRLPAELAPAWHGPLALAVFAGALLLLRGGRQAPRWLIWGLAALGPFLLGSDLLHGWGRGLEPPAAFWCLAVLGGGLLLGWRLGLGLCAAGLASTFAAVAAGPASSEQWQRGLALAFALVLVLTVLLQAVVWQRGMLRALEEGRRQLALGLAQRRRLLGTLFHDVANPLNAMLSLCELGRAGLSAPGDAARVRRLCQRLRELLADSQGWMLGDGSADGPQLQAVVLEPMLAGMADLYQERLATKRLGLSLEVEAGLSALAPAAVLRDSVISNLMSNAIKFSRPGSSLELEALTREGAAWIELRDRGPGLDPVLLLALAQGRDLPSSPGTGGEGGQGLGLALAREHLQRMGGRLEILPREGGGTVARIVLRLA